MSFVAKGINKVQVVITNVNGKVKVTGDSPLLPTILRRIVERNQPISLIKSEYCAWFTYQGVFFKTTERQSITPDTVIDIQVDQTCDQTSTIVTLSVANPVEGQIYDFCAIC